MTTITLPRATVEQALETIEGLTRDRLFTAEWAGKHGATITNLRAALAQQDEPEAYGYASRLAVAIWEKHYKDTAPQWKPLDDLMGVLTQIDNMTSGLTRLAQQAEPVQEPVGKILPNWSTEQECIVGTCVYLNDLGKNLPVGTKLYTAPPRSEQVLLTDDEIESCRHQGYAHAGLNAPFDFGKAARAVEQASWEKNHGQA